MFDGSSLGSTLFLNFCSFLPACSYFLKSLQRTSRISSHFKLKECMDELFGTTSRLQVEFEANNPIRFDCCNRAYDQKCKSTDEGVNVLWIIVMLATFCCSKIWKKWKWLLHHDMEEVKMMQPLLVVGSVSVRVADLDSGPGAVIIIMSYCNVWCDK